MYTGIETTNPLEMVGLVTCMLSLTASAAVEAVGVVDIACSQTATLHSNHCLLTLGTVACTGVEEGGEERRASLSSEHRNVISEGSLCTQTFNMDRINSNTEDQ